MTAFPMKVEIENLSEVKRKLRIEVDSSEVTHEVDKAYRDLGKKAKVKGFRPGKVPRSVLELYYQKQVEQEVSDTLVRRSLGEALKDHELAPVNLNWPEPPPQVVPGEDYRYTVELEIPPDFKVEDYLELELSAPEVQVTDAEVEARLEEIRQHNATLKPAAEGRGVQEGDFVVLDYQAFFAAQAVEGAKAEGTYMEVGKGRFNQDFERNLVGLRPGAESRFAVDLPNDFANPLLAGKEVEFQVKIHEVKEKVEPELDDAFAQNLGGNFKTVADLREAVREDIIKGKEKERQAYLENQAMDQLLGRHPFELPPSMVQQEQENVFREQWERLGQHGVNLAGIDHAKMMEASKPLAERRVRIRLMLERIASQEGIEIDDAEVEATLGRIALHTGRDVAEVKKFYDEHDLRETLKSQLRNDKTMKLLLEKAHITAAPETPGEGAGEVKETD